MRRSIWLAGVCLVVLLVSLVACGSTSSSAQEAWGKFPKNAGGYAKVSPQQLNDLLKDKDFTLVNVHIP